MTNTVLIKRSGTANAIPLAANVALGELAINYNDGNLFYKNSGGAVTLLTSNQFVSVAGNVTGGNLNAVGLSLSGNVLSAINSTSNITTTGNVSGSYFIGNGSQLTGIVVSGGTAITNGTSNVIVAGNSNVTVGITGTTIATFASTGEYVIGLISATGNITGDNILTGGLISATGNITGGNIVASGTGGNISGANVVLATTLSATANVIGGNINTAGLISATGNITAGNLIQGTTRVYKWTTSETPPLNPVAGDDWYVPSSGKLYQYWDDVTSNIWVDQSQSNSFDSLAVSGNAVITGNVTGGNLVTGGNVSAATYTGTTVSVTGNITGGILAVSGIVNTGSNATGNIGNSTIYFNTVFAKATSAQYADLAEMYVADAAYKFGTVVVFGGTQEVTVSSISHDTAVAGVISRNPAHTMNAGLEAEHALPVALTGRVRCQVQGPVRKGDVLVNIAPGIAGKLNPDLASWGCVIGKSLEDLSSSQVENIEIVVGRY